MIFGQNQATKEGEKNQSVRSAGQQLLSDYAGQLTLFTLFTLLALQWTLTPLALKAERLWAN